MTFIPSITRVVTGFTINDGGSGYSSSPTVTISGGSGQFATATATVTDGVITALTITNQGSGYETAPTVTITDSTGAGADIDSIIGDIDYKQKLESTIQRQLPEFIQIEHPGFVDFLEGYYRFLDQDGEANNILLNMASYSDVDLTTEVFVEQFRKQYANELPVNLQIALRRLVKVVKDFYESKGSEDSIELLFRLLFNESIEIFYPSKYILKASDGVWIKNTLFRVVGEDLDVDEAHTSAPMGDIFDLVGKVVDVYYYVNEGSAILTKSVETIVTNVTKLAYTDPPIYELETDLPASFDLKIPGAGASGNLIIVDGEVKAVTGENFISFDGNTNVNDSSNAISSPGHGFSTGDPVLYHDGGGTTITGLTDGDLYYVIKNDDDTIQLAASSADASGGTEINITSGSGSAHSLVAVNKTFETSDITTGSDTIDITAHGYSTGDVVLYQHESSGSAIGGLIQHKTYYVIEVSSGVIKLASSLTNAENGTAIDLTSVGSGTHTFSRPISDGGNGYYAAPTVEFISLDDGADAVGRAVLTSDNTISHIVINDEGADYVMGRTSLSLNTSSIRTHIHLSGSLTPVYGYLQRQLSTATVVSCSGTPPCGFSVGDLISINQAAEPYALNYFAGDYTEAFSNNNAIIQVTAVDADGCPTAVEIFNPGYGFDEEEFTATYTNPVSGCSVTFSLTTGPLRSQSGYWKDSRGKVSDANYLQDNYYYQDYSYVIRSGIASNRWIDILKKTLHPAGTEVFGELIISQTVDYSPNIGIGGNIHFYEFDWDDEPVTSETHYVDFYKPVEDTASASEAASVLFNKVLEDSTSGATDAIDTFDFDKVLSDTPVTSQEFAFALSKTISDSVSVTDSPEFQQNYFFYDSIYLKYFAEDYAPDDYVASDVITYSVNTGESDSSNATDTINNFVFGKGLSDTASATESLGNNISKVITDSVTVTELLSKALPGLNISDTTTLSDSSVLTPGLSFTETAVSSESFNKVLQVAKSDTGSATEIILTETSFDRDPGDSIGIAESSRVIINKGLAETLGITDSGNINNQDYVESGYVSGVGASGDTFGSNTPF